MLWAAEPKDSCPTPEKSPASRVRRLALLSPSIRKSKSAPASLKITEPSLKSIVGSTVPVLYVQTIAEPDPHVVVPTSVASRFKVIVSVAVPTVSIPFVPPAMVNVSPEDIV